MSGLEEGEQIGVDDIGVGGGKRNFGAPDDGLSRRGIT
jgi:hypothetical protein